MADMNLAELMNTLPIGDIAAKFGVDESTAKGAIGQALPALLSGMSENTRKDGGAAALESALDQHRTDGSLPSVDAVDVEDGKKIVRHVLGDKEDEVARGLSAGGIGAMGGGLLATLAPIVMAYLANKKSSSGSAESSGGIGDILGGLLGGGSGGGIGDMLGGALGGMFGGDDEPEVSATSTTKKSPKKHSKSSGGFLGGIFGKIFGK